WPISLPVALLFSLF
ncbi:GhoT/OrtT family toxin, partial [Escherichia coli]|nr:GhoT/OrtT family toxin [Escherichia coli]